MTLVFNGKIEANSETLSECVGKLEEILIQAEVCVTNRKYKNCPITLNFIRNGWK